MQSKGTGILGRVIALAPAHKEQCQKMLHSHWQVWVEELLPQVGEDLWNTNHKLEIKTLRILLLHGQSHECNIFNNIELQPQM